MQHHAFVRYRDLFLTAWKRSFFRHTLWIFGVLASFVTTGGIIQSASQTFSNITTSRNILEQVYTAPFLGQEWIAQFIQRMTQIEPTRMIIVLTGLTILTVLFLILSFVSQGSLLAGLGKHENSFRENQKQGISSAPRLFLLGLFTRAVQWLLVLSISVPLAVAAISTTPIVALVYVICFLIFFPAILILHGATQLTAIDIVRHNKSFHTSFIEAWRSVIKNWLIIFEVEILCFLLVFLALIFTILCSFILAIPFVVVFLIAAAIGSSGLVVTTQVVSVLVYLGIFLTFIGAITTFQQAVWVELFERLHVAKPELLSKLERLWSRLWS